MNVYQACFDTSDAIELFLPQNLYLKPIARLNISVQLPLLKVPGKTISNWEVMEKVRNIIKPDEFSSLKVSKSTLEFVRLEAEIDNKGRIPNLLSKLDSRTIKLSGFTDVLKVRAAEAKIPYPTRHMWDSYFRDSKHMNDIKPGERPDTIHICNLPSKWFTDKLSKSDGRDMPSDYIFKKVFEAFGEVRVVDIPMLDPFRNEMKNTTGISTFFFGQDHSFEGYVQFKEYVCFVKAMTALKGMKLLYKDGDKAWTANIKVDFDKTKHLSDESIRKRAMEREKILRERKLQKEEEERKLKELEERKREEESRKLREEEAKAARERQAVEERQRRRETRRKEKELLKQKQIREEEKSAKLSEEKAALAAECRRIKSMRLLRYLLEKAKVRLEKELILKKKEELLRRIEEEKKLKREQELKETNKLALIHKEKELRGKLLARYKAFIQRKLEEEEKKINKLIDAKKKVLINSVHEYAPEPLESDPADNHSQIYDFLDQISHVKKPKFSSIDTAVLGETFRGKGGVSVPTKMEQVLCHRASSSVGGAESFQLLCSSDSGKDELRDKYVGDLAEFCRGYFSSSSEEKVHRASKQGAKRSREDLTSSCASGASKKKAHNNELSASKGSVSVKSRNSVSSSKHSKLSKVKY
ncbi:A-kinase anchor protein 17A [Ischnura elegans]|uniref:A-kinase anchor protein 17A n=1 Tax=Ischnura elegans TaxID=197161 RepID=UPI001ED8BC79|nr:A-kinase anchor protein 17A [Ischnura elegans]